jgi:uncharacterized protein (DUF924 family)
MIDDHRCEGILRYWFGPQPDDPSAIRQQISLWFTATEDTDRYVRRHFEADLRRASVGALDDWEQSPRGRLALIVLLDQFPRNIYRGTPAAFAHDAHALRLCLDGLARGHDTELRPIERLGFYLPMQHAENLAIQEQSVRSLQQLVDVVPKALQDSLLHCLDFAVRHRNVIAHFGRFPHRNVILGRPSTPEEKAFLSAPGSSF